MFFPIEWAQDGSVAPGASEEINSGLGAVVVRKFSGVANEDVIIPFELPVSWGRIGKLQYSVCGWITEAVLPAAGETVRFTLQGTGIDVNGSLNVAFNAGAGYVQASQSPDMNGYAQYDRFQTAISDYMLVDTPGAGFKIFFNLIRTATDAGDTYAQDVGVDGLMVYPVRT